MKKKMTNKKKMLAYVLNIDEDFGYSMKAIGEMMGVAPSTISNAIKEVAYQRQILNLQRQLQEAKEYIYNNTNIQPKRLEFASSVSFNSEDEDIFIG